MGSSKTGFPGTQRSTWAGSLFSNWFVHIKHFNSTSTTFPVSLKLPSTAKNCYKSFFGIAKCSNTIWSHYFLVFPILITILFYWKLITIIFHQDFTISFSIHFRLLKTSLNIIHIIQHTKWSMSHNSISPASSTVCHILVLSRHQQVRYGREMCEMPLLCGWCVWCHHVVGWVGG